MSRAGCEILPLRPIWQEPVNVTLDKGMRQAPKGYEGGLVMLSAEALRRAVPWKRPSHRLQRFMANLLANSSAHDGPFTISVIGGSMSAGTYCLGPWAYRYWQKWCSWPAYLRVWLERSFPGRALRVVPR